MRPADSLHTYMLNGLLRDGIFYIPFKIIPGNSTGMGLLGRLGSRWEDNIRIFLEGIDVSKKNLIDSAYDREWRSLVNAVFDLQVS